MNTNQQTLTRLHEIITKSTSGAIVLPANPTQDAIAAGTALYLGLTKMGKNVSFVCTQNVQSDLTGADKIQSNLVTGGDNLVVSFPYTDGAIDKVDYNIQGEFFNLIVAPRQGFAKLDPNQVKYSYTGGNLDFIIVVDSPTLNNLGSIYTDNQTQFQGREIINIDRHLTNSFFGTVNLVNKTESSVSELILSVLQGLRIEVDKDIATNLYAGISTATNNFTSYSVNADTFEHIATLLRMGALKKVMKKPDFGNPTNSFEPQIPQQPKVNSSQTKFPQTIRNSPEVQEVKPIETVEKEVQPEPQSPQDWLKPKIFKGSGLI